MCDALLWLRRSMRWLLCSALFCSVCFFDWLFLIRIVAFVIVRISSLFF